MKYANPEHVELIIQKVMLKTGKTEEESRQLVLRALKAEGYVIGIPLEAKLHEVSVRAGEQAVIENLKRIKQGLPHASHQELMQNIRYAQMRARENVVIRSIPYRLKPNHLRLVKD